MQLKPPATRPLVWQDQHPRGDGRWPTALPGHGSGDAGLPVDSGEHRLDVGDDGLDLDNQQQAGRRMPSEDVDRSALSPDRVADLGNRDPARGSEPSYDRVDQGGVALVQQAVQSLALPEDAQVEAGPERFSDRVDGSDRAQTDLAALDSGDRRLGRPCPICQLRLRPGTATAERAEGEAESDGVHSGTMAGAAYRQLTCTCETARLSRAGAACELGYCWRHEG